MSDESMPDVVAEIFDLVIQIAEAQGDLPIGWLDVDLGNGWRLLFNGTDIDREHVPPVHGVVACKGMRVASVSPFGGAVAVGREQDVVCVLRKAVP